MLNHTQVKEVEVIAKRKQEVLASLTRSSNPTYILQSYLSLARSDLTFEQNTNLLKFKFKLSKITIASIRMNSTLSSLLNSLSLTLNSPLSANQQNVPASQVNATSVVVNSTPDVNNNTNTNTSPTAPATNSSTPTAATGGAVENSPTVSFLSLQTELGEVRHLKTLF